MQSFLHLQQEVHAPWLVSAERWGHGYPYHAWSLGYVATPRRQLTSNKCQSQSQPVCTQDPPGGTAGCHSPECEPNPLCYGALPPGVWSTTHPLKATNAIYWAVESCQSYCFTHMATSCGDPHCAMDSMLPGHGDLLLRLWNMRPRVGLYTMQVNTDNKDMDEGQRHPDIWVSCGPPSLSTGEDLQSCRPQIQTPQCLAGAPTSHSHDLDVASLAVGATSHKWPHNYLPKCTVCCWRWVSTKYML